MIKAVISSAAAAAVLFAGLAVAPAMAADDGVGTYACTLTPLVPTTTSDANLRARADRQGCSTSQTINIKGIRHKTAAPDQVIADQNRTWTNGLRTADGACNQTNVRPFKAHTTTVGGGHSQSSSVNGWRCP